jgi:hypothetical protein
MVPQNDIVGGHSVSGSLEEGLAEGEVPFDRREIQQRQKSRLLPYRRGGVGYGARHDLDKVSITAVMEAAEEAVAPVMLRQTRSTASMGGVFQVGSPWPTPQ